MIVRSDFTTLSCLTATLAIGLMMLATTDIALAGETVRDHRGANGAPEGGVTVDGKRGTVTSTPKLGDSKGKGFRGLTGTDYGKGPPTGAIVRDHRTCGWGPGRPNRPCS
jgi:hypothetical protein